ncbi:hypothetical protein IMZ11_02265 [Microtetraspora sp. AC03309]|uniref:hypothetical protein n=1 Tax=Microtetraspora sp. AC03309 TaxID=2779376 RepID=UPI001E53DC31|nr:hypothetical protein [Microtetraspora sp. AC03309]MCC5574465.1 hypothetical protein [Microtetraspora sp. AC03309]
MDIGQIWHCEASYSGDAIQDRADLDDVHPAWGIHMHWPDMDEGRGASLGATIYHARLESMCARYGFDVNDLEGIVDTILHLPPFDAHDPLLDEHPNPGVHRVRQAIVEMPDPQDPRMPYSERRDVLIAHADAVRQHMLSIDHAPREDRQAALDFRSACIDVLEEQCNADGIPLPARFRLNRELRAPRNPLAPLIDGGPLDGRRVMARRARDEYLAAAADRASDPAVVALQRPQTFGFSLDVPRLVPAADPQAPSGPVEVAVRRAR